MKIIRINNEYIATQELPNGHTVKGTGHTVGRAIMWALWGVKSYFRRLERVKA